MSERIVGTQRRGRLPAEGSEADLVEQSRPWRGEEDDLGPTAIPIDAPEADVLEQARQAPLDEDDH